MTKEKIELFLEKLGYETNKIISLQEVSSIYSISDDCFYPDESTRFEFKTTDNCNLLLIYNGTTQEDGSFKTNKIPDSFVSFSCIAGFNLISPLFSKSPYKIGRTV